MISWFETNYYEDSILRGVYLVAFVIGATGFIGIILEEYISYMFSLLLVVTSSLIASMFIAQKMLHDSVYAILTSGNKKETLSYLVSRDTQNMSESDVYKAGIETYAENLSDGVIAPLFYLLLFGLPGIIVYKAINTMDSMVGYKSDKYENYGKAAALLDDAANYIPSRITAVLIMIASSKKDVFAFYEDGQKHDSPNAGHPITAMALALDIKLGGDTSYAGKIKKKAYFGCGREEITQDDLRAALKVLPR